MHWVAVYGIVTAETEITGFRWFGLALFLIAGGFYVVARRRGEKAGTARVISIFALLITALGYGVNTWDRNRPSCT